jgi:tetratricopeptide (TPR) repeat protein
MVEQAEELFTTDTTEIRHLAGILQKAIESQDLRFCLLITLRNDLAARVHKPDYGELARLLQDALRLSLPMMEAPTMQLAVEGMMRRAGLHLSEGLAERIVRETVSIEARLPLLGHLLCALWASRQGTEVTHALYEKLGGVGGALARSVETTLAELNDESRGRAKWLLLALVRPGRGGPDTRQARTRQELLRAAGGDDGAVDLVRRLLGEEGTSLRGDPSKLNAAWLLARVDQSQDVPPAMHRLELVHEALLSQVPTLFRWINEERPQLDRIQDLENTADGWEHAESPDKDLPAGSLLRYYRAGLNDHEPSPVLPRLASDRALRFLKAAYRQERRRVGFTWALRGAFTIFAALIALFAAWAWQEKGLADRNQNNLFSIVNQFVGDYDWSLAQLPHTLAFRRKALGYIGELLHKVGDGKSREAIILDISLKHRRADISYENERLAAASDLLASARQTILAAQRRWFADPELQDLLALNDSKRGKVALARGQSEEARRDFAASIKRLEIATVTQQDEDHWQMLGTGYAEMAELLLEQGNASESVRLHTQSVEQFERAHGRTEDEPYNRTLLALALSRQAGALLKLGAKEAAQASLNQALSLQEPLWHDWPANLFYRSSMAQIHLQFAKLYAQQNSLDVAAEHFRQALDLGHQLRRDDPAYKNYALLLAQVLQLFEEHLLRRDMREDARPLRDERCALVVDALRKDAEDSRFRRLACTGADPGS